jgi:Uma2 family endonuclease
MLSALPKMTAAEFRELPAGPPFFQLVDGHLVMSPSPSPDHQNIILNLAVLLRVHLITSQTGGAIFVSPIDVYLSEDNVFEPDLVYLAAQNAHFVQQNGIQGAPDLVVEVLSPSTGKYDKNEKREAYEKAGVKQLWLIYPTPKKVEVYGFTNPGSQPTYTYGMNDVFASEFFPGLKIKVADLFAPPFISRRPG